MEQRTDKWYMERLGRFTASKISVLLGKAGNKKTDDAINNYAIKAASEMYFGIIESDYQSFDMQRGTEYEPYAFAKYRDKMELDFIEVTQCGFIPFGDHAGASPDGKVSNGRNLEIKVPTIENFGKIVVTNEIKPEYIAQMQMQMLCAKTDVTDFYNYCVDKGKEYDYTIEVPRDEDAVLLIMDRIEIATELKLKHYQTLCDRLGAPLPITIHDTNITIYDKI